LGFNQQKNSEIYCSPSKERGYLMRSIQRAGKLAKTAVVAAMVSALAVSPLSYAAETKEVQEDKFVRTSFSLGDEAADDTEDGETVISDVREEGWSFVDMTDTGSSNSKLREAGYLYEWTIDPGIVYEVKKIYRKSGQKIQVNGAIISEAGRYSTIGIIEPDYVGRAVTNKNAAGYTFKLTKTGNYSVFFMNENSVTVTVDFIYYLPNS
jgi:hypothetical protein